MWVERVYGELVLVKEEEGGSPCRDEGLESHEDFGVDFEDPGRNGSC